MVTVSGESLCRRRTSTCSWEWNKEVRASEPAVEWGELGTLSSFLTHCLPRVGPPGVHLGKGTDTQMERGNGADELGSAGQGDPWD